MKSLIICLANFFLQIETMKDLYLDAISEMDQEIAAKLQQVCCASKIPCAIHKFTHYSAYYMIVLVLMASFWRDGYVVESSGSCPHGAVNTPVLRNTPLFTV